MALEYARYSLYLGPPAQKLLQTNLFKKESINPKLAGPEEMTMEWCEIHGYRGDSSFPHSLWKGPFARKLPSYFPFNPGCWIGILKMAHCNPHITGQYIPLYILTDQGPFFSLLKCLTGLPGESHYDHPWYWKMQQHRSRRGSILAI